MKIYDLNIMQGTDFGRIEENWKSPNPLPSLPGTHVARTQQQASCLPVSGAGSAKGIPYISRAGSVALSVIGTHHLFNSFLGSLNDLEIYLPFAIAVL